MGLSGGVMLPWAVGNRLGCREIVGLAFFSFFGSGRSFCTPLEGVPGRVKWMVLGRKLRFDNGVSTSSAKDRDASNDVAARCGSVLQCCRLRMKEYKREKDRSSEGGPLANRSITHREAIKTVILGNGYEVVYRKQSIRAGRSMDFSGERRGSGIEWGCGSQAFPRVVKFLRGTEA